jgi:hypothetical protein
LNSPFTRPVAVPLALQGLEGFTESRGRGHIGGPQCPWCEKDMRQAECLDNGNGRCPHCNMLFRWQAGPTPAGFAFTTWQWEPETVDQEGPEHGA